MDTEWKNQAIVHQNCKYQNVHIKPPHYIIGNYQKQMQKVISHYQGQIQVSGMVCVVHYGKSGTILAYYHLKHVFLSSFSFKANWIRLFFMHLFFTIFPSSLRGQISIVFLSSKCSINPSKLTQFDFFQQNFGKQTDNIYLT